MNPGRTSRTYGMEYLKHVSHSGDSKHYLAANNGWPKYVLFYICIYVLYKYFIMCNSDAQENQLMRVCINFPLMAT